MIYEMTCSYTAGKNLKKLIQVWQEKVNDIQTITVFDVWTLTGG